MEKRDSIIIKAIVGLVIFSLLIWFSPITCVATGHKGVVKTFGAVSDRVLNEGINIIAPWQSVTSIDVRIQKVDVRSQAPSKDLQEISTVVALSFHLSQSGVNALVRDVGTHYEDTIINPRVMEIMKAVMAQFTASELITKRDQVSKLIEKDLRENLIKYFIVVDEISMKDFDFSKTFTESIELKQKAEQDALRAENELRRIKIEAQQQIATAQAEAESLRLKSAQVTSLMVELERIKKWNGIYPTTMTSGSATMLNIK